MTSVLGNVSLKFSDEQSMLMDVARGFLNDKAPTDKIREFLESDEGYEPQLWSEIVDLGWTGPAQIDNLAPELRLVTLITFEKFANFVGGCLVIEKPTGHVHEHALLITKFKGYIPKY